MAQMKVISDFLHENKNYKVGEIIEVYNRNDQQHLIRTGQAVMETLNFKKKEEKQKLQTKELKVEKDTKSNDEDDLSLARQKYFDTFGKRADKRWKITRIIDEINKK